ncbi:MAG: porin family protein, partial [Shewanella sp.]|nr:porin family protein [Shewanella sp.]
CCSFPAFSQDESHNLTASLALGLSEGISGNANLLNDDLMIGYDVAYQYRFNTNWGIEVGFRQAEPELFTSIINNLFATDLVVDDASSVRAAAVYSWALSKRNKLYFKAGVQQFDVSYRESDKSSDKVINNSVDFINKNESGTSIYAGIGWRYEFDSGLELGLSYDYQDMDLIDIKSFNLGIGYSF